MSKGYYSAIYKFLLISLNSVFEIAFIKKFIGKFP